MEVILGWIHETRIREMGMTVIPRDLTGLLIPVTVVLKGRR